MATEIRIPTTGNAGEDAVLVEWLAAVGDQVSSGQTLLTVETAKSTVDIEAPADGTLLAQHAGPGDEVAEFSVVGIIGDGGETVDESPRPESVPAVALAPVEAVDPVEARSAVPAPQSSSPALSRISASPRAKRTAAELGIDVRTVRGSGPLGRILAADVELAAAQSAESGASTAQVAPQVPSGLGPIEPVRVVPVRGARKVTAQRMHASLTSTAQVTLTRYAEADRLVEWVRRLREAAATDADKPRVSVNDALLFAVSRVVGQHPAANSWFDWDGIQQFERVDLGFAVDTEHGLFVPVIRDAHTLTVGQIARSTQSSIERAKGGRLQPDEMAGGTFTVSNLGGLGIHWFTPVLNPPQSCILGVGAAHATGDGPSLLPLSLTFDHRALDGGAAATLLADLAAAIEHVDVLDAL